MTLEGLTLAEIALADTVRTLQRYQALAEAHSLRIVELEAQALRDGCVITNLRQRLTNSELQVAMLVCRALGVPFPSKAPLTQQDYNAEFPSNALNHSQ